MRVTLPAAVNPVLVADTVRVTLGPVMYDAAAGTFTDQVAGLAFDEVAVRVAAPITTDTDTPSSEPVSPVIVKPASFSAMLIVSLPATAATFSASVPAGSTVRVNVAVPSS